MANMIPSPPEIKGKKYKVRPVTADIAGKTCILVYTWSLPLAPLNIRALSRSVIHARGMPTSSLNSLSTPSTFY